MMYLKSVPDESGLVSLFRSYPEFARPLLALHEEIMRAQSPFAAAERELIAAYVSGLNSCSYCHDVHSATAAAFGVAPEVLASALDDLDTAAIDERMKPVLRYVRKLTQEPARVTRADADAIFAAGWDDRALLGAVQVCALFNFMNRIVEGTGIEASPEYKEASGQRLRNIGYTGLATLL
jgi:uncharacterized peroxidase-related enzyme